METTVEAGYRILEHPADIGIEAWGTTLSDAFRQAVHALMAVITDPEKVHPSEEREVHLTAEDSGHLLVRLLSEALFHFDAGKFLTSRLSIREMSGTAIAGSLLGETLDPSRHILKLDVKAVTYHQLSVADEGGMVRIRVFLDV